MNVRFICLILCLTIVNCKEAQPELIFKYADKPIVVNCDSDNSQLFNEAIYSFEENLIDHYANKNPNLTNSYRSFLKESSSNTLNYNTISNEHSLAVFEALKTIEGLWVLKNNELSPNYNHVIFKCIGKNIQDKDIKATFNALLSTNSMSFRMLKDVLTAKSSRLNTDKYLATYVALELYYSKLSYADLSKQQDLTAEPKPEAENDPHAGHNH